MNNTIKKSCLILLAIVVFGGLHIAASDSGQSNKSDLAYYNDSLDAVFNRRTNGKDRILQHVNIWVLIQQGASILDLPRKEDELHEDYMKRIIIALHLRDSDDAKKGVRVVTGIIIVLYGGSALFWLFGLYMRNKSSVLPGEKIFFGPSQFID